MGKNFREERTPDLKGFAYLQEVFRRIVFHGEPSKLLGILEIGTACNIAAQSQS